MTDNVDVLARLAFVKWSFNSMMKKLEAHDDPLVYMLEMFKFEQSFKHNAGLIAEIMGGESWMEPKASESEYDRSFAPAAMAYRDQPSDERDDIAEHSTMNTRLQGIASRAPVLGRV